MNLTDNISLYVSCAQWDQSFEIAHTNTLKTSFLWSCILNGVLAIHTFVLNLLIVVLFFKERRLQTTANILILALALSDLAVALLSQPASIVNNALRLYEIHSCLSELTISILNEFVVGVSAWTVCITISFERLLAIRWPFKHRVIVTKSLLMKIFFVQVAASAVISLIVVLRAPLKILLAFQSALIFLGVICVLMLYPYIALVVHKRSQTVFKTYAQEESQNSKREKTLKGNLGPKAEGSSSDVVSQNSKHANKSAGREYYVSQDSKRELANYTPEIPKRSPNNMSHNSNLQNELTNNVSHGTKRKSILNENSNRNSLEIKSRDSKHDSPELVSHNSNGNELKITNEKLKVDQRSSSSLHIAMIKSKQELQVCKAMAIITAALVLCFVPRMVILQCLVADVIPMQTFYNYLGPWLDILVYANSSLNPYIYFFYKKDISEAVKKILFGKKSAQPSSVRLPSVHV